jgi:hypothetical protein
MAAATKVQMRLTVPGGIALYEGPASPSGGGATEAMFSTPVQALIPANVSRVGKVPVECSYTLTVGPYRLAKRSGFLIDPSRQAPPPAPSLAVRPGPAVIGPAWTDIPANGSFTISADGEAAGGSVEFPSFGAFSFPQPLALPARESQVSVRFQPAAIGLHRGKASAAHRASGVTIAGPELTAHGYAFTGPTEWRIQGHGPGPAAGWVQRDPASPEQPLQPASAQLADDQGRTASVAVGADGTVTLSGLPPGRPRTVYTGDLVLRYGTLPPRTVRAVYADAPPTTRIAITGSGTAITPGAAWRPGTWATATQEVVMDSGVPGRVVIELSDLTGPDGEILSASRDLRAVVGTAAVSPGRPARFEIRMYRGQDALPGTYRGTAIVVFTPDGGSPERITQPIDVVMP